jgi:hypothetical protein
LCLGKALDQERGSRRLLGRGERPGQRRQFVWPWNIRGRYIDEKYRVDPVALWRRIEEDRKAVVTLDKHFLFTQLYETKLEDHGTVTQYLDALNAIADNLKTCGKTLENDMWFYITRFARVLVGLSPRRRRHEHDARRLATATEMLAEEAQLKRDKGLGADSALTPRSLGEARVPLPPRVARTTKRSRTGRSSASIAGGGGIKSGSANNGVHGAAGYGDVAINVRIPGDANAVRQIIVRSVLHVSVCRQQPPLRVTIGRSRNAL